MMMLCFVIVIHIVGLSRSCSAHLNLFMNSSETKRTIGINGELFYVRNGIINEYALSFVLPIKPDTDDIFFDWQSLRHSPSDQQMYYQLFVSSSNRQALKQLAASIPSDGQVPSQSSVFSVHLPCNGLVSADVNIRISLNISLFSTSNITNLEIRRQKTCLKDDVYKNDVNNDIDEDSLVRLQLSRPVEKYRGSSSHVFYIGIGCACGMIVIIALTVLVCYLRSHKTTSEHFSDTSSTTVFTHDHIYQRTDTPNRSTASGATHGLSSELRPADAWSAIMDISIARSSVTLSSVLLEGTFGRVYLGTLSTDQQVLVKTITDQARPDQVDMMIKESCLMKGLNHININSPCASCCDTQGQPPMLIYPFLNEGNLKKFLQRCRLTDVGFSQTLNTQQLVYMAVQVSRGIQYLHRQHVLHNDVATRNCLVDSELSVKVTDTALARDLFPRDYHCLGDNENRPIKWMAIEAIIEKKFSAASDMWSFGVLLWEMMTLALEPYVDIDPFEMASYLHEGYRVSQPSSCPNELFAIMACCWALCPEERPKFSQLQLCLQDFYTTLTCYV